MQNKSTDRMGSSLSSSVRDDQELEALMRSYGNDVLRTAFAYVKDMSTAEDIFQEVFIKVDRHLDEFRQESSIKTWLIRITINTCKDYLKSAYHRRVVPIMEYQEDALTSEDDYKQIEEQETVQTVREAVALLPEPLREVVICVYFQEMSVEQTAKCLGIPDGTVKSRLSRARERMKKCLEGRL